MRGALFALFFATAVADSVLYKQDSGEPLVIKTHKEPFVFEHVSSTSVEHPIYGSTTTSFYTSPDITLKTGEAWFSLPDVTVMKMPQPGKPYGVVAVKYDIVEAGTQRSVALNELYSHHWLVYDKLVGSDGFNVGCGGPDSWVSNIYGAGAEMRGVHYIYPPGYGHIVPGDRHWSANIHFIRTEDLSTDYYNGNYGAAVKGCIECEYAPGKGISCVKGLSGFEIFGCCFDGGRCPVNNPKDTSAKKYNLVYNITWTTDVEKVRAVRTYVIDVFGCMILQNLKPNEKTFGTTCGDKLCTSQVKRKMPVSGYIRWAYLHQHIGGFNATLAVNGVSQCSSFPQTGTDMHNAPGNEKGYVVGFDMCIDPARPKTIRVNKGDELTVTALVSVDPEDTRAAPVPGGSHTGMMGLFYFFFEEDTGPGPAPGPSPAPAGDAYVCSNDKCIAGAGGVPLKTCQAVCGPGGKMVV